MLNPVIVNHDDSLILRKSNVTEQPDFSDYPIRGIPWDVVIHPDYRMSTQQIAFFGNHMQLIEMEAVNDTSIQCNVVNPTVFVVVMIEGFVKFQRDGALVSYAMGGVMYMTYNPRTDFTFNVSPGKHTMMVVSLDRDWAISAKHAYPELNTLVDNLWEQQEDIAVLPMCRLDDPVTNLWEYIRILHPNPFLHRADLIGYASRLTDFYHRQLESGNVIRNQFSPKIANTIFSYVDTNYISENGVSISKLAEHTGLTKFKLEEYTRFLFGKSLHKYVRDRRMAKAAQLLRSTDQYIPEIALKVGYSNLPHFYEVFHRYFGMSPLLYRKIENEIG